MQDETSAGGEHDFLARLCVDWEETARLPPDQGQGCRSVSLRSGVVLGRHGGMIQQLIVPFWLGLGGRMGSGDQPLAWIHVKDLASLVLHCLEEDACRGVLNAVAPEVVRNREFVAEFARVLDRPAVVPVPESVFNLLYGEERAASVVSDNPHLYSRSISMVRMCYNLNDLEMANMFTNSLCENLTSPRVSSKPRSCVFANYLFYFFLTRPPLLLASPVCCKVGR